MKLNILITQISLLIATNYVGAQPAISNCNYFELESKGVYIDSNALWQIGIPEKEVFNDSFSDSNSLVTDIYGNYKNNDTSSFYVEITTEDHMFPNYLGIYFPLIIEFKHRFLIAADKDTGLIDIAFNNNKQWYNINKNQIIKEGTTYYNYVTEDTLQGLVPITGNSNGWIFSTIYVYLDNLIYDFGHDPVDTILVRFSFITDSSGINEGWQIDDLCLYYPLLTSINNHKQQKVQVYPNPFFNVLYLQPVESEQAYNIRIVNITGQTVYSNILSHSSEMNIDVSHLKKGIYNLIIQTNDTWYSEKIIKN